MANKSKDKISKALLNLMIEEDYEVLTVLEICDNTDLVRKTFYNNFSSKIEVIEYICDKLIFLYLEIVNKNGDFTQKNMSNLFFVFGKKNEKVLRLLIKNDLFHIFQEKFLNVLPEIQSLSKREDLDSLKKEDLEYVFYFMGAGTCNLLRRWVENGCSKTEQDMTDIYNTIVKGID